MKKILLTLAVASVATFASAQRTIDWSVEQIILPTSLTSSTSTGTTITYEIVMKNNGTDTVFATDTIGFQLSGSQGSTVLFAFPNGGVYTSLAPRTIDPNDTIHFRGSLSFNTYPNNSVNITFRAFSVLLNRENVITAEGTGTITNNSKTAAIIWYNPYNWGVNVNSVFANNLQVYPNPATTEVFVKLNMISANSDINLTLTDMSGRTVYSENVTDINNISINTSDLAKGVYMLQVVNGDIISNSKISIQ